MPNYYKIVFNTIIEKDRETIIKKITGQYLAERHLDWVKYIAEPYLILFGSPINIQILNKKQNNDYNSQKEIDKVKALLKKWRKM